MNGIAISLYDKFEDLAVLVDIIRTNWENNYFISVCSNHPEAEQRIGDLNLDLDAFEKGAQIRYQDTESGPRSGNTLCLRIYNTLRTACLPAIKHNDVEHVMHLHADAWPLSEKGFLRVINEAIENDAGVAFSTHTTTFIENFPPGTFEDQFIVFDCELAEENDLFAYRPLQLLPITPHYLLPMLTIGSFGWHRHHQYDRKKSPTLGWNTE
jgi:hypothetical protein